MTFLPVALATLADEVPVGTGWICEAKLDGYRIEAVIDHTARRTITLYSRNAKDWTARFPTVVDALQQLPVQRAVLDGEIVFPVSGGRSAFQALQRAFDAGALHQVHYVVFDLLRLDDVDVRTLPLRERHGLLDSLVRVARTGIPRSPVRLVRRYGGRRADVLARACADGLEGVVCKRLDARYAAGRHGQWIKVKCIRRQEFVIVGFTEPRGSRTGFGALLLGYYDATGELRFAGKVGTGFDTRGLQLLHARLLEIETRSRIVRDVPALIAREAHWVKPVLVAEVAFTEWTDDGRLRHPVFHGLRDDKPARSVVREDTPVSST